MFKKIITLPLGNSWLLYFEFLKKLHENDYFENAQILTSEDHIFNSIEQKNYSSINPVLIKFPLNKKFEYKDKVKFEEKYGIPNLGLIEICNYRDESKNIPIESYFDYWEDKLSSLHPDLVILSWPASVYSISFYLVAKQLNIPITIPSNARMFDRSIIRNGNHINDLFDIWSGLEEKYNHYKKNGLSFKNIEKQDELISLIKNQNPKPFWFNNSNHRSRFKRIKNYIKNFKIEMLFFSVTLRVNRIIQYKNKTELPDQNYFFFPLHYEPEMAIDLLAPFFRRQETLIEYIHQSLPANILLVVKEHPSMIGRRRNSFYKHLKNLDNLILSDPRMNSYKILKNENCKGVITINSTAGYEAMMLGLPVLVFGNTYYMVARDLVKNVTDLTQLPELLIDLLKFKPDIDSLRCFLQALEDLTFKGIVGANFEENPHILSEENIDAISNEFVKRFPPC